MAKFGPPKIVVDKFDEHIVPKRNVIHDHACFHKRTQWAGETMEAFVQSLYETRDRIMIGILDEEVSQRLQLEADLTLERAIQLACQSEQVKQQSTEYVESGENEVRRQQYVKMIQSYDKS